MKKSATFMALTLTSLISLAGGSATIDCGSTNKPTIHLTYATGSDATMSGLFWLGIISPDQNSGVVLTEDGWAEYKGGLYPFQTRYDNGLPSVITKTITFPYNAMSTGLYQGYTLYVGHGAYTTQAREKVAVRREVLTTAKPELVARGRWRPENDNDLIYVHALVQKNMVDNQKYGGVLLIPALDCTQQFGN
ncbi:MAG: hypothetical protein V4713_12425 [Pseudomonadota bacterium]